MGVMSVSYLTVEGEIISETRNGVESDYIPDPLGSTVALTNSSQTVTDTFSWWPFGELRSHTGSSGTPFGYGGTRGYAAAANSASRYYVRAREMDPVTCRWMAPAPIPQQMAGEHPYAYVENRAVTFTDPSGLDIYVCKRALRLRDFRPGCWINTKTPSHHWWIYMDSQSSPCQSIGYGPGGRLGHRGNLGAGYLSDISCVKVSSSAAAEKCVCDLSAKADQGWDVCGSVWVDSGSCHPYKFVTHNCQDYTI